MELRTWPRRSSACGRPSERPASLFATFGSQRCHPPVSSERAPDAGRASRKIPRFGLRLKQSFPHPSPKSLFSPIVWGFFVERGPPQAERSSWKSRRKNPQSISVEMRTRFSSAALEDLRLSPFCNFGAYKILASYFLLFTAYSCNIPSKRFNAPA